MIKTFANGGFLSVIEFKDMPFTPRRCFWVTCVPAGEVRGGHAHYKTQQVLVCVRGHVEVRLDFGDGMVDTRTLGPDEWSYVPAMVWDEQRFESPDAVLLVLANTEYDKADYIEDYEELDRKSVV